MRNNIVQPYPYAYNEIILPVGLIDTEFMLPFDLIDSEINQLLIEGKITRKTNEFFLLAKTSPDFSLEAATKIAVNWREITKQFLFTVMSGLGKLAEETGKYKNPPHHMVNILQSGMAIISDDLSNVFPTLNDVAPKGPDGAHYKWWEDSVIKVLNDKTQETHLIVDKTITPGVQKLLKCM